MLNKGGAAYQRLTWDALRKSINGLVNKVNAENIRLLLPEIFAEVGHALKPASLASLLQPACMKESLPHSLTLSLGFWPARTQHSQALR